MDILFNAFRTAVPPKMCEFLPIIKQEEMGLRGLAHIESMVKDGLPAEYDFRNTSVVKYGQMNEWLNEIKVEPNSVDRSNNRKCETYNHTYPEYMTPPNPAEKPIFHCNVCNKSFSQKINLQTHQTIHSGKRPFRCDVCGKLFTQRGNLQTHQSVHSGKRPFACNICGKAFSQKGNLQTHEKIHTGDKQFKCEVCDKSFIQKINLQKHKKTHTENLR